MTDEMYEAFRRVYWGTQHPNFRTKEKVKMAFRAALLAEIVEQDRDLLDKLAET